MAQLLTKDWGLWRTTTTMNLEKVLQMADHYPQLSDVQKSQVVSQVKVALKRIEDEPKATSWKLRARVGDRVKWYKDVEELLR